MKSAKFILPLMLVLSTSSCGLLSKLLNRLNGSSSSNTSENSGSGNSNTSNSGGASGSDSYSYEEYQALTSWPSDISSAFESYIGEMVPFVALNANSVYGGYDNTYEDYSYGLLVVGDNSTKNVMDGYESKLTSNGYSKGTDDDGETVYTKTSSNGKSLELYFDYYQATSDYPAGNEIAVYFNI